MNKVTFRFAGDNIVFSNGKRIYAYGQRLGIGMNDEGRPTVSYGSDGDLNPESDWNHEGELTHEEKCALASWAITQWLDWSGMKSGDDNHTMEELYDHRTVLFSIASRSFVPFCWRSRLHSDGTMYDGGWFIAGYSAVCGEVAYHIRAKYWELFDHCRTLDFAPEWDGYTSNDVLNRLIKIRKGWQP